MTRSRKPKREKTPEPVDDYDVDDMPVKEVVRKDGWPVEVPVLVEDDLIWNFSSQDGRHDIAEWLERTFDPVTMPKQHNRAAKELCSVISERFKKKVTSLWLFLEFTKKNKLPSLAWQAACFNETLARLGYDIPKRACRDPGFKTLR
jgi:hypothetical protein